MAKWDGPAWMAGAGDLGTDLEAFPTFPQRSRHIGVVHLGHLKAYGIITLDI